MKASVFMAIAISVLWQSSGCDLEKPAPTAAPLQPAVSAAPARPIVIPDQITFSDLWMRQSSITAITGDLRPFWRVHGRLGNASPYTVTSLRLVVQIWSNNEMKDSAVFELKAEVPPGAVQSFEQQIHLSPPNGKWNWNIEAVSVEAENR
jgi:hypothetical protein